MEMTPEQVVQHSVDFYNQRNIGGFMSLFADDVEFFNFADGERTMQGSMQCRQFYTELFEKSPKLHSTIINRIVFGNRVIDHEQIAGRMGSEALLELVMIYEVKDSRIVKATAMRN
jgi:hypothetical protein